MTAEDASYAMWLDDVFAVLEHLADGFACFDANGNYTRVNTAFARMLQRERAEFHGTAWHATVHADDRAGVEQAIRAVRESGAANAIEPRMIRRDGSWIEARGIVSNPAHAGRSVPGHLWHVRDVTDEKRMEQQIARQGSALVELARRRSQDTANFETAARTVTRSAAQTLDVERVSVWLYDADRPSIKAVDLYERSADRHSAGVELLAAQYPEYFRALDEARTISANDARTDVRTREFTDTYLVPLGITSMLDAPLRLHGRFVGVVCHEHVGAPRRWTLDEQAFAGSVADMLSLSMEEFELRRAEAALRASEAQLRQAHKMEALGRLAGGVAHDFNNILTLILGYSSVLLAQDDVDEVTREAAEEIQRAGQRAASLTKQLLAVSRRQILQPKLLDMNVVVGEMAPMLRRLIPEGIALNVRVAPEQKWVQADRGQIEQVVMNLCINARDAMPDGGRLTLETMSLRIEPGSNHADRAAQPGTYAVLSVSDTGTGIDDAIRPHLFEPFFTTKPVGKGTGLGLATVDGIVRQSGGFIELQSVPGHGSSFAVHLPAAAAPRESLEPALAVNNSSGGQTVLLVEDEEAIRALARSVLSSAGYTVLVAANADEATALAAAHAGRIHLLLTDVVMPGLNGRELARSLVASRPDTRVLFMSGYPDAAAGKSEIGAVHGFLEKPFAIPTLLEHVRAMLDES